MRTLALLMVALATTVGLVACGGAQNSPTVGSPTATVVGRTPIPPPGGVYPGFTYNGGGGSNGCVTWEYATEETDPPRSTDQVLALYRQTLLTQGWGITNNGITGRQFEAIKGKTKLNIYFGAPARHTSDFPLALRPKDYYHKPGDMFIYGIRWCAKIETGSGP